MVVPISQSAAAQRAGRAGRTRAGTCFRLYARQVYTRQMPKATVPEIQRLNLASPVLYLFAYLFHHRDMEAGVPSFVHPLADFAFIDAPDRVNLERGLHDLLALGALEKSQHNNYRLTPTSQLMLAQVIPETHKE